MEEGDWRTGKFAKNVILSRRRTANCRALGYTTLYVLYKEDLSEALNDVTISLVNLVFFLLLCCCCC